MKRVHVLLSLSFVVAFCSVSAVVNAADKTRHQHYGKNQGMHQPGPDGIDGQSRVRNIYSYGLMDLRLLLADIRTLLIEKEKSSAADKTKTPTERP